MLPSRLPQLVRRISTLPHPTRWAPSRRLVDARRIWTTATHSDPALAAALDCCLGKLEFASSDHAAGEPVPSQPDLCVVLVSGTYPGEDLQALPAKVFSRLKPKCLVGAVVDAVAVRSPSDPTSFAYGPGLSITTTGGNGLGDTEIIPFHIPPSRHRRFKAVGRWPEQLKRSNLEPDAGDLGFTSVSTPRLEDTHAEAADGLAFPGLGSLGGSSPIFLMFTDREPHRFLSALDRHVPKGTKFGIAGTQTPFITGTPYTLFYNDKAVPEGLVGVAITPKADGDESKNTLIIHDLEIAHPTLAPLGEPLTITNCRGNIILELDEGKASRHLLGQVEAYMRDAVRATDRRLYMRIWDEGDEGESHDSVLLIISGDPTKGTLALDTTKEIVKGMKAQFMIRDKEGDELPRSIEDARSTIQFSSVPQEHTVLSVADDAPLQPVFSLEAIAAQSESGFVFGTAELANASRDEGSPQDVVGKGSVLCDLPHSEGKLSIFVMNA
ncbi:uncharacterized protein BJ171DRAFT_511185 [Polychytrium aggregatum]|uniref:uncharacterized protein n=1 Tax=Polychytrium aggregatum TaxID=110093 RepID=UPI0022FE3403|nr:uncharacterized protein BJ171DRAFT_511185 [Polychytrium aggregatum]KAI9203229.1 hypothetical protein BJ171DRAFT_511185 [Polychytrium aggregatum]